MPVSYLLRFKGLMRQSYDEMWSYVGNKNNHRWLWHAIDHASEKVLAYVFWDHQDKVFLKLKALLEPFGLTRLYTDDWGAYERHLASEKPVIGKRHTQKNRKETLDITDSNKTIGSENYWFFQT